MYTAEATKDDLSVPETGELAVLLSHPTGNQNVRNALRSLVDHHMLAEFCTTIAWDPDSPWNRLVPSRLSAQLERRSYEGVPQERISCVPAREIVRLGARSSILNRLLCSGERPFSIIGVYRHFDNKVARRLREIRPRAVYAYEGGALQTFREAKRQGITTIYEQPSSYWYWVRSLLSEEAQRRPEYAELLPNLKDSTGHLRWKDQELSLADYVIVPSQHVRRTLAGAVSDEKIRVVSYGAPAPTERRHVACDPNRPLKVLFVGGLTQHKGIGYLLDAIDLVASGVELTLVGRRLQANARVDAACRRWRWFESVPHHRVLELMSEADVLVLPSFGEGFGLVVTEALACGLPVIVTPNVGAADLIRDGREGFIVPLRSAEAIAQRLDLLRRNRDQLAEMSRHAQVTAAQNGWEAYRANWANVVRELC
jgi:starch synthase